ncbi:MAG: transcription-repair coupling factor [Deltaproteobacteria bacterium]|nr:transcription-repair coupling factor [Deltaproteobacteria bacterium]
MPLQGERLPVTIQSFDLASEGYWLAKKIREHPSRRWIRLVKDQASALQLKENLQFFLPSELRDKVFWFPPFDALPYSGVVPGSDVLAERLRVLHLLQKNEESFFLIVPMDALLSALVPPSALQQLQRAVAIGDKVDREEIVRWLIAADYKREDLVESPGDFAVRGAIVDIFSPSQESPIRLEFDGEIIDKIRLFDPATQISRKIKEDILEMPLIPAGEFFYSDESYEQGRSRLKKFADSQGLPTTVRRDIAEKLKMRQDFIGKETFLPCFYDGKNSLFDYLPPETEILLSEVESLKMEAQSVYEEIVEMAATTQSPEKIIPPETLYFSYAELESCFQKFNHTIVPPRLIIPSSQLKNLHSPEQIRRWQEERLIVRFVCHTPVQKNRLQDILENQGLQNCEVEIGNLSHGFGWLEEGVIVLTEEEIFGHKTIRRGKPSFAKAMFADFSELNTGDFLVHEEYGVSLFKGLHHLNIQNIEGDYLKLEFLGGDALYLPIYRLQVVGRYIGGKEAPILDRLGSTRWQAIKNKARKEVLEIAAELLKIHAQRQLSPGISYPALDAMDEEFASHFPFDETPDQANAILDVLKDLQMEKPMDRLICGDVGYGKTEVALRAAFKVVNSGRQVAFLVPTTILALQHFETFQERFSKMAVHVEMISRFRSHKEQKEILSRLAKGDIDIVIGTHRLFRDDVKFKKLGLLIVDEEQRFGVKHKEEIKKMRPTIDVLTLSATPIPRTLHMSLIGLRDFSMIQTPPVDRLSIRTFLAKWDDAMVKNAIQKELDRKGQVFFVHNRVKTIPSVLTRLQKIFPGVRVAVAHGQMKPAELEKVMIQFLHKQVDVLLCTTIIESGIDVPGANTMLVHRADMFGLAQLYQLRGRVGRSDRQAYCYLLIPDEEGITPEARKRLEALTRYTDLGAGFQIAAHDLEIRGAGNLLGSSQAGMFEEIGYEMYTTLLARAIRRLKGEVAVDDEEDFNPEISLPVPAYIPTDYVEAPPLRMSLYKRLSHLSDTKEVEAFETELFDRFGPLPLATKQLLDLILVKQLATALRISSFKYDGKNFVIEKGGKTVVPQPGLQSPAQILEVSKKLLSGLAESISNKGGEAIAKP